MSRRIPVAAGHAERVELPPAGNAGGGAAAAIARLNLILKNRRQTIQIMRRSRTS